MGKLKTLIEENTSENTKNYYRERKLYDDLLNRVETVGKYLIGKHISRATSKGERITRRIVGVNIVSLYGLNLMLEDTTVSKGKVYLLKSLSQAVHSINHELKQKDPSSMFNSKSSWKSLEVESKVDGYVVIKSVIPRGLLDFDEAQLQKHFDLSKKPRKVMRAAMQLEEKRYDPPVREPTKGDKKKKDKDSDSKTSKKTEKPSAKTAEKPSTKTEKPSKKTESKKRKATDPLIKEPSPKSRKLVAENVSAQIKEMETWKNAERIAMENSHWVRHHIKGIAPGVCDDEVVLNVSVTDPAAVHYVPVLLKGFKTNIILCRD